MFIINELVIALPSTCSLAIMRRDGTSTSPTQAGEATHVCSLLDTASAGQAGPMCVKVDEEEHTRDCNAVYSACLRRLFSDPDLCQSLGFCTPQTLTRSSLPHH